MNTYIQNKLDELIETYRKENVIEGSRAYFTEYDAKMIAKRLVTHYQNHIVEKIVKDVDMTDQQLQDILSLLQDTNKE